MNSYNCDLCNFHSILKANYNRHILTNNYYSKFIPFLYADFFGILSFLRVVLVQTIGLFRPIYRQVKYTDKRIIAHKSTALAAQNFMLSMSSIGYATCPMEGMDTHMVKKILNLTPKSEIEGEMGDARVGLHARLMSQALRKLTGTISKTNCCVIFINQLREKIGVMFGNPETTTGGNALKFYSSVRLDIRRSTQIKDGDRVMGNRTRVKVVKNKVAPPFRLAEFDIMYGLGISKAGELIDLGVEHDILTKSGSWFSYGETRLGQGRDTVKQLFIDNPELAEEVEGKIKAVLAAAE